MWASSHSSAGRRRRRNTEGGHKLKLDMVPQAAFSPAERGRVQSMLKMIKLHGGTKIDMFSYILLADC